MVKFSYPANEQTYDKANSTKKIIKGLKRLFIIAGIIAAAQVIWLFAVTPFIPFSTIEVQVFEGLTRAEILRIANITETSSYISTNVNEVRSRLSANVLVESARVIKRFPDKLSIFLTPREAVAVTLGYIGSRQSLLYIDRQGVLFKTAGSKDDNGIFPVLSGIENPQVNMQFPASLIPLFENISVIAANSPQLLGTISEIRIERKAWDGYDLVLYPVHSTIRVRVESNLTEEILRYMLLMLNVLEFSRPKPKEVDFRSGMGSYTIKEPSVW